MGGTPLSVTTFPTLQTALANRFRAIRLQTLGLCAPLTPEDMMVQSCSEASPAKWHLAHTTWFLESFVLRAFLSDYQIFHPDFEWLFNSYYESFSPFPEKRLRSSFSRPALEQILQYREHVDAAIERLLENEPDPEALRRIELGVNHEEQHQELLLTDILNAFFTNPLRPKYSEQVAKETREGGSAGGSNRENVTPLRFLEFEGGLRQAGHNGEGFRFDNELPRHRVWLESFNLANRLVSCDEYAAFISDGGYRKPELWLSAGWDAVKANGWRAPLYWTEKDGAWSVFTLRGELPLKEVAAAPVSQVSYYEADAFARWAGHRLPTEFEWEAAAEDQPVEGNLLDSGFLTPIPAATHLQDQHPTQWYGDCWVWTSSAYLGYPGFRPLKGTLGEYNGKFMSGQMVLRGGSCVTPAAHIRSSYRNFFSPETRWQFSGIRLAS
jgi:ergothioneine biosynthesis protein EgtB